MIVPSVLAVLALGVASPADTLAGLWTARRRFGPDVRGSLILERRAGTWSAMIQGWTLPVRSDQSELSFALPEGQGAFKGRRWADGGIRGMWFPPASVAMGGHATPVRLAPRGSDRWIGDVTPFDDVFTFHLLLRPRGDGSLTALMRNTERDWGARFGIERLVREQYSVKLVGRPPGQSGERTITAGSYDPESDVLTFRFAGRGGSYDFRRAGDASEFLPRDPRQEPYVYRPPPALGDGWPVGTLESARIDRPAMEAMVRVLAGMAMDSTNAPQVHAVLIARDGRLVLEEYFHGEHRLKLHDTRSGSKSVTALLVGAAMQAGLPVRLSTPVFATMTPGALPADPDPRRRAMTLEHLLTMSSGFFCDDSNDQAPGGEERMWDQTGEPDFWTYTLGVPMASAPGEQAFYCSGVANLALGVLGRAVGQSPYDLFERLLAEPLGITRYAWIMDRARQPYGGGAMQFLPRDYMKFGQLMLNGGTWGERRILSRDFVTRATRIHSRLGSRKRGYGYLWWVEEYPFRDRTIRSYASLGLGGQMVVVFPELDLVVATQGGSYSSNGWRYFGGELIPKHILPAVR